MKDLLNMINKNGLSLLVKEKLGCTGLQAKQIITAMAEIITEQVEKGKTVRFDTLGKFFMTEHKARKNVDPISRKLIDIPAKKVLKFSLFKKAKNKINKVIE